MFLLGLDIGTSSVKASLIDGGQNRCIASAFYPKDEMPLSALHTGWAEQDPESWWQSTKTAIRDVMVSSRVDKKDILAIGISYQMHGLVCVDKNGQSLRPSIIWCDSRAISEGDRALLGLGEHFCLEHLLNAPGNFTAAKLSWVKQNEPSVYQRIYKIMLPGDYIAMRLSGDIQSTVSGLSEGIFYDYKEDRISSELLSFYGIDESVLPEIVKTFSDQTCVSEKGAQETGLAKGTRITYRAGDQPNNALSLNVLHPGEMAATAGTSGVVYGVTDSLSVDPLSRINAFAHVNHQKGKPRIGVLLCINGTGILYSWARSNLSVDSYEEMNKLAAQVPIGSKGLMVIPFGNGAERILSNTKATAGIHGLEFNIHSRSDVLRAMKEGVAFSFKYGLDIMRDMDFKPSIIRAGKANMFLSGVFTEAISNLAGAEIELYNTDGAQGAARGAGIGLGYYDFNTAFSGLKVIERVSPSASKSVLYQGAYEQWKALLEKLVPINTPG